MSDTERPGSGHRPPGRREERESRRARGAHGSHGSRSADERNPSTREFGNDPEPEEPVGDDAPDDSDDPPESGATRAGRWLLRGVLSLVALLILVSGVWTSWDTMRHAVGSGGGERGTLTLQECGRDACAGSFAPFGGEQGGDIPPTAVLAQSVGRSPGESFTVVLRPGTVEAVRTGGPGVMESTLPFAGALMLASLVVGGGLRMVRTGWVIGISGIVLLGGIFLTW
ncbi:hypothetical protein [Streptomyces sp. ST2-7A]|uniref:hypothetical protein n=1 Tax=Streptomyces sp. ST2-7A TaxID=2907214 RepID=UPI001F3B76B8|nr:hypothetical protein [Streptomyces sp. ST2-7A]MCE7081391.1 hypothetical protein [Streptomyces sp. ST2-7A]